MHSLEHCSLVQTRRPNMIRPAMAIDVSCCQLCKHGDFSVVRGLGRGGGGGPVDLPPISSHVDLDLGVSAQAEGKFLHYFCIEIIHWDEFK